MITWSGMDFVIVGLIGLSALTGLMRGFFKELISLITWILAIWLAIKFTPAFSEHLRAYVQDGTVRSGVAFVCILLATLFVGMLVNVILGFALKHSGLSTSDRILGMGFGFVRGVVIVSLVMLIVDMTGMNFKAYQEQSKLYGYFNPIVSWMGQYVQPFISQTIKKDSLQKIEPQLVAPLPAQP